MYNFSTFEPLCILRVISSIRWSRAFFVHGVCNYILLKTTIWLTFLPTNVLIRPENCFDWLVCKRTNNLPWRSAFSSFLHYYHRKLFNQNVEYEYVYWSKADIDFRGMRLFSLLPVAWFSLNKWLPNLETFQSWH